MTNFPSKSTVEKGVVCVLNVLIELYRKDLDGLTTQLQTIEDKEDLIEETKYRLKIEIRQIHNQYNDLEDEVEQLEDKESLTDDDKKHINEKETVMRELNTRRLFMTARVKDLREESVEMLKVSTKLEVDYDRLQQNILKLQDRAVSIQSELKGKVSKVVRRLGRLKEEEETKEIDHNDMFCFKKNRT